MNKAHTQTIVDNLKRTKHQPHRMAPSLGYMDWNTQPNPFRCCNHDIGHALAALRIAANLLGWKMRIVPSITETAMHQLLGFDKVTCPDVEEERDNVVCRISARGDEYPATLLSSKQFKGLTQVYPPRKA